MQALRQIEATIDSVVSVLSNSIPGFVTASSGTSDPQVGTSLSVLQPAEAMSLSSVDHGVTAAA